MRASRRHLQRRLKPSRNTVCAKCHSKAAGGTHPDGACPILRPDNRARRVGAERREQQRREAIAERRALAAANANAVETERLDPAA